MYNLYFYKYFKDKSGDVRGMYKLHFAAHFVIFIY